MFTFLLILFIFGTIFGSFSSVLIERWHSWKWGILTGRSECPKCKHILGASDLVPIFSYISRWWKCAHCQNKVSLFYPLAELLMGSIFALMGYASIRIGLDPIGSEFLLLLIFSFITGVYILYDIRYMEIPDQIMVPAIYFLVLIPFLSLLFIGYYPYTFHAFHISTIDRFYWAYILYTFFYLQIYIPWSYYLIKNKDWANFGKLTIGYITFPISILVDFFRTKKDNISIDIPVWIGWGDLRIAIFIWLTLGTLHGISSFAIAYITGSIVGIWLLIVNHFKWKKTESQIPFWPFLGLWWILSIVYYNEIELFYNIYFNYVNK